MINPAQEIPGNVQGTITTSVTNSVNKKITTTFTSQESKPKVKIFIGIKRMFKMGLTRSISRLKTIPAIIKICQPPRITNAGKIWLVNQRPNILNAKTLTRYFMRD